MKKYLLAALFSVAIILPSFANTMTPYAKMPAGLYKIDQTHASLTWKVSHLGLSNYTARFAKFDAALIFDPADVTKSKLIATVDPTSIRTDYPNAAEKDFDKVLATGEEWFNGGKFPEIKFESTKIVRTGDTTAQIYGNLSMLGVSKEMVLDAVFNGAYESKPFANIPALGFSATGKIKRSEWGMATYIPAIGDEVAFSIEVEFSKSEPENN